uniref:Uncharacterized protein n=1 Tax=Ciona intestinalis TaxID=7719 RepID=H2XVK8_CIOIN
IAPCCYFTGTQVLLVWVYKPLFQTYDVDFLLTGVGPRACTLGVKAPFAVVAETGAD